MAGRAARLIPNRPQTNVPVPPGTNETSKNEKPYNKINLHYFFFNNFNVFLFKLKMPGLENQISFK
jgi:hypothetical protein